MSSTPRRRVVLAALSVLAIAAASATTPAYSQHQPTARATHDNVAKHTYRTLTHSKAAAVASDGH